MPWKKLKAGVFSLFGETFKLAGKLVVGIGAVGIGLLLVATTTIDHQEGKEVAGSFSSLAEANTTLLVKVVNPQGTTFGPYLQNFTDDFLEKTKFTPIPSNSNIGSMLDLAMNYAPLVLVAGFLIKVGGERLSTRAARLRKDELDEAYEQGLECSETNSNCFKKNACGALSTVFDTGSTTLMLTGLAIQGGKEILKQTSNYLPVTYRRTFSPISIDRTFVFHLAIEHIPLTASIAAFFTTKNTKAEVELGEVKQGIMKAIQDWPDAIPYSLYCGALILKELSVICAHKQQCYLKFDEGEKKGRLVNSRDIEMGYTDRETRDYDNEFGYKQLRLN